MDVGTKFQPVIDDPSITDPSAVERIYCVSGKFYYELLKARQAKPELAHTVALVRIEELCPFPYVRLREVFERYPNVRNVRWAQEEHQNYGAWYHVRERLQETMMLMNWDAHLTYYGLSHSAMPAPGSSTVYKEFYSFLMESLHELPQ